MYFYNGACSTTPPPTRTADSLNGPDFTVFKMKTSSDRKTAYLIKFDLPALSFGLSNIAIETDNGWKENGNFEITVEETNPVKGLDAYLIHLKIFQEEFYEEIRFYFSGIQYVDKKLGTVENYCSKDKEFLLYHNSNNYLGLKDEVITRTHKTQQLVADYGHILGLLVTSITAIMVPLNVLRLLILIPKRFPRRLLKMFLALVNIQERDFMAKTDVTGILLKGEDPDERIFVVENHIFNFVSIYQQILPLRVVIRALTILFYLVVFKYSSSIKSRVSKLMAKCIRTLLILDNVNSLQSMIYMVSSISSARISI
jgi:hypothetical protein